MTPAGYIPLAAMDFHLDRLARLKPAMEDQAKIHGKRIYLCKFEFTGEIAAETKAGQPNPALRAQMKVALHPEKVN